VAAAALNQNNGVMASISEMASENIGSEKQRKWLGEISSKATGLKIEERKYQQ